MGSIGWWPDGRASGLRGLLAVFRLLGVGLGETVLEFLLGLPEVSGKFGNLRAAEQKQDHDQNDDDFVSSEHLLRVSQFPDGSSSSDDMRADSVQAPIVLRAT